MYPFRFCALGVLLLPVASVAASRPVWFHDVAAEVGIAFPPPPRDYTRMQMPDVMAAGAALFDADGDDDLDVLLVNQIWQFGDEHGPDSPRNRLFRQGDDGRFEDVTLDSGLTMGDYGIGVAIGDYDNDGREDVYFANYGRDRLYRNVGDGRFEDVTDAAGISVPGWSCSVAFFDYDLDGWLDLYVTQYVIYDSERQCKDPAGRPDFCGPIVFAPTSDVLLHNEGDGTFTDVSVAAGLPAVRGAGLGVVCEDFSGDGLPDIYVANDAYANNLWVNMGDGTFLDDALLLGAAFNEQGMAEAGMGVVSADFDNDGDWDLFITHLKHETHTLYRNIGGDLGFEDATTGTGLGSTSMPYTGFGTFAFDVELDGDLDLFVANGAVSLSEPWEGVTLDAPWRHYAEPNQIFVNDAGASFHLLDDAVSGLATDVEVSRGAAAGDVDGDGDIDLLVANCYSPPRLYRNDAPREGSWLIVEARDPRVRRHAVGASVHVWAGGRRFLRPITAAVSYQSSCDPRAHFGLGKAARVDSVVVQWPDGLVERFPSTGVDQVVRLERGRGEVRP